MVNVTDSIKIEKGDKKLLAHYKIRHSITSYSKAIRHAVARAEQHDESTTITSS